MSARQNRSPEDQRRADLATIHIAKKELNLSDEVYRETIAVMFKTDSSADLTADERRKLINYFKQIGFKSGDKVKKKPAKKKPQSMGDFPTEKQKAYLTALSHDIQWRIGRGMGLRGFMIRMIGLPWPQTKDQASKMIEHLKLMKSNQQEKVVENAGRDPF